MLKARLNPEAKKPPNGAMMEAKMANGTACNTAGISDTVVSSPNYIYKIKTITPGTACSHIYCGNKIAYFKLYCNCLRKLANHF